MPTRRVLGVLLLVAILGAIGFGTGRFLFDRLRTEAQAPETPRFTPELARLLDEEKQKPRFTGELLGIFIAPTPDQIPDSYDRTRALCAGGRTTVLPWEEAGSLDFPRPLILPPGYEPVQGPSTGVFSCQGVVNIVNREYTYRGASSLPANITVGRTIGRGDSFDVAAERIVTTEIGGRKAILVRPVTPDGTAQTSAVIFPEPFGMTYIHAAYLPEDQLLALAEAVARASQ